MNDRSSWLRCGRSVLTPGTRRLLNGMQRPSHCGLVVPEKELQHVDNEERTDVVVAPQGLSGDALDLPVRLLGQTAAGVRVPVTHALELPQDEDVHGSAVEMVPACQAREYLVIDGGCSAARLARLPQGEPETLRELPPSR